MDTFLYFLFSSLEYCALQTLMFKLFRMGIYRRQLAGIVFLSIVLSNLDYVMKFSLGLGAFSLPVQILFLVVFTWLCYDVHLFYSVVTAITSFAAYILLQLGVVHALTALELYGLEDGHRITNFETIRGQVITIAIAFLIAWLLKKQNAGFTYIPDSAHYKVDFNTVNKQIAFVLLVSVATLGFVSYSFWNMNYPLFVTVSVVLSLVFWLSIYMSFKKERSA